MTRSFAAYALALCTSCAVTPLAVKMKPSGAPVTSGQALAVVDHCWNKVMAHRGFRVDLKPETFRIVTDYYRCTWNGCRMGFFTDDTANTTVGPGAIEIPWARVEEILPLQIEGRTYVNLQFTVKASEAGYIFPEKSSYSEVWTLTCDGTPYTTTQLIDALALLIGPDKLWR